jgi:hypothetical protein
MKKEYTIKDQVWIHNGEKSLVEGRVVEVIDLTHLNEGHLAINELYVIEIKTGIDDIYEVRPYELISPDATGPINLFRNPEARRANRYFKKIGMDAPIGEDTDYPVEEVAVALAENTTAKPKRKFYSRKTKK